MSIASASSIKPINPNVAQAARLIEREDIADLVIAIVEMVDKKRNCRVMVEYNLARERVLVYEVKPATIYPVAISKD